MSEQEQEHQLVIEMTIPGDVDSEEAAEAIAELTKALNACHVALGGSGLELVRYEIGEATDDEQEPAS